MILLLTALCLIWLIAFYFLIIKFKQDAKNSKKTSHSSKGRKNPAISATEPDEDKYWQDRYEQIIEDYPTIHRNINEN